MPTKTTKKKQQKVLSQAAQKRLELERQEAAKSKAEKLAESIGRKGTVSSKHATVIDITQAVIARNTPNKTAKLKKVPKVKAQTPMLQGDYMSQFEQRIEQRDRRYHQLLKQAELIRKRFEKSSAREKTKLYEGLRDCYAIYDEVELSSDPEKFYGTIHMYLMTQNVKLQSNTPSESVLIRFMFGSLSAKQASEYATVVRYARQLKVAKNSFVDWLTRTTMTKVLEMARKDITSSHKEDLQKATALLLRYFDIREQAPMGQFDYPLYYAKKQVHLPNDLMFVVCRGVNQFNRGTPDTLEAMQNHSYASINALHFIPPNVDMVNDIVTRMARALIPYISDIEQQLNEKSQELWADDLTHILMERELGDAYKSADRWANRQQAAIAEDQVEFESTRKKIQKLRNKARKSS